MGDEPLVISPALGGKCGFGSGVRELYGAHEPSMLDGTTEYRSVGPIEGTGWLVELYLSVSGGLGATRALSFRFMWTSVVVTTSAEMDAGEAVFPRTGVSGATPSIISVRAEGGLLRIGGPFAHSPRGRFLTFSMGNASGVSLGGSGYFVWERCGGGGAEQFSGGGACWS